MLKMRMMRMVTDRMIHDGATESSSVTHYQTLSKWESLRIAADSNPLQGQPSTGPTARTFVEGGRRQPGKTSTLDLKQHYLELMKHVHFVPTFRPVVRN